MNDDIVLSKTEADQIIKVKMAEIEKSLRKSLLTKLLNDMTLHKHCWHSINETDYICCWCGEVSVEFHGKFNPDRKDND